MLVRRLGAGDARALQELYERYARRAYSLARRIAAPLWTTAVLVQAATRDGYDITRHPASMLANGNFGWVRVATFLVTGALMLGCAAGAGGTLLSASGRIWVPRLITAQGLGLLVAGVFRMDPGDGFPAGTPAGPVTTMSWHATIHNLAGTIVFLAMIATCLVLARRFRGTWAWTGRTCGAGFAAGLVWCYGGGTAGALTLFLGVVIAWSWISATAARLTQSLKGDSDGEGSSVLLPLDREEVRPADPVLDRSDQREHRTHPARAAGDLAEAGARSRPRPRERPRGPRSQYPILIHTSGTGLHPRPVPSAFGKRAP